MKTRRILAFLLVLAFIVSMICGCSSSSAGTEEASDDVLQKILASGKIRVAGTPNMLGIHYEDPVTKERSGICADIIKGYAAEMGLEIEWVGGDLGTMLTAINQDQADVFIGNVTITLPRTASVTFTDPWLVDYPRAIVPADSDIQTFEDLNNADVTIVTGQGSIYNEIIPEKFPNAEMMVIEGGAWLDTLQTGRADAMYDGGCSFLGTLIQYPGEFRLLEERGPAIRYGLFVKYGEQNLKNSLDTWLAKIKVEGTYNEIYSLYYGEDWVPNYNGTAY